jgi:hypothetical protein
MRCYIKREALLSKLYSVGGRWMYFELGETVEWDWQGKVEMLWEKLVRAPLCPKKIPHGLAWNQTWVYSVNWNYDTEILRNSVCQCQCYCDAKESAFLFVCVFHKLLASLRLPVIPSVRRQSAGMEHHESQRKTLVVWGTSWGWRKHWSSKHGNRTLSTFHHFRGIDFKSVTTGKIERRLVAYMM